MVMTQLGDKMTNVAQKYQQIWKDYASDIAKLKSENVTTDLRDKKIKSRISHLFDEIHALEPEFSQYLFEEAIK